MKTKSLLAFMLFFGSVYVFGQKLSVDLTFTAVNNGAYVQLNSTYAWGREIYYDNPGVNRIDYFKSPLADKHYGFSVRCIHD